MATFHELTSKTDEFFDLHWPHGENRPAWCGNLWTGIGPVPSYDSQGCYALVEEDAIKYIGVAVGRGSSKHRNFGLSYRIVSYLQKVDGNAEFKFKPGLEYTGLYTIGFPEKYAYLALALEQYLISQLAPVKNKRGVRPLSA